MSNHYHQMSDCCPEINQEQDNWCLSTFKCCFYCMTNTVCASFLNICCCHCSCVIFPGSSNVVSRDDSKEQNYLCFINKIQEKQSVPYIELSTEESRTKNQIVIYFHGNSQNVGQALQIAYPIFKQTQITMLLIEYPTYGSYIATKTYNIADQIKSNSIEFYNRVCEIYGILSKDIYIIGRSIGSGPACHLASKIQNEKLVLISPFDTISQVAKEKAGCIGSLIHNHFNNVQEIKKYQGKLLAIHGKNDEVISINNAANLVKEYEGKQQKRRECQFIQPPSMTHNRHQRSDLTDPIAKFFCGN